MLILIPTVAELVAAALNVQRRIEEILEKKEIGD